MNHALNIPECWRTPFLELFQLDPVGISGFNKQTHFWAIQYSRNPGSQFKATLTLVLFGLDQASFSSLSFLFPSLSPSLPVIHTDAQSPTLPVCTAMVRQNDAVMLPLHTYMQNAGFKMFFASLGSGFLA